MRKLYFLLFIITFSFTSTAQVAVETKEALVDLYNDTQGEKWNKTWNLDAPVKDWHGVTVVDNKVTQLNLMFNNLNGVLPVSIGNLKNLQRLELSFNKIEGSLPQSIGALENLEVLAINGNMVTGLIPSSIGDLTLLKELHLSSNELSGNVPTSMGNLKSLKVLNLFDNSFTGTLPINLLHNDALEKVVIAENEIINNGKFSEVVLFNVDNENTPYKIPAVIAQSKKVLAIETSDDEN